MKATLELAIDEEITSRITCTFFVAILFQSNYFFRAEGLMDKKVLVILFYQKIFHPLNKIKIDSVITQAMTVVGIL